MIWNQCFEATGFLFVTSAIFVLLTVDWRLLKRSFKTLVKIKSESEAMTSKKLIQDLVLFSDALRAHSDKLDSKISQVKNTFFREALMFLSEGVVDGKALTDLLESKIKSLYQRQKEEALAFKTMGRYPALLGTLGSFVAGISFLQKWQITGNVSTTGYASLLAILIYPLIGFILKDMICMTLSYSLLEKAAKDRRQNLMIAEGVTLVSQKVNPIVLIEKLNAQLPFEERVYWGDMLAHQMRIAA